MRSETLENTTRILSDLVGFPTISADSNLEMIAYASELLSALGARLSMTLDESGHKANLFATLGPEGDGGIVLSGHSDVVPVEGQEALAAKKVAPEGLAGEEAFHP